MSCYQFIDEETEAHRSRNLPRALTEGGEFQEQKGQVWGHNKVGDFMPLPFCHRTLPEVSQPEQNRTWGPATWDRTHVLAAPRAPCLASSHSPGQVSRGGVTELCLERGLGQRKWTPEETELDTPSPWGQGSAGGRDLGPEESRARQGNF